MTCLNKKANKSHGMLSHPYATSGFGAVTVIPTELTRFMGSFQPFFMIMTLSADQTAEQHSLF
jgi:hypothetical protein